MKQMEQIWITGILCKLYYIIMVSIYIIMYKYIRDRENNSQN